MKKLPLRWGKASVGAVSLTEQGHGVLSRVPVLREGFI